MKRLYCLFILSIICILIYGQTNIPTNKEFYFLPLNTENRFGIQGYDSFYVLKKHGNYNTSEKNRFKPNSNRITPAHEIDYHIFEVIYQTTENKGSKKERIVLELLRDHVDKIFMVIPCFNDKKYNLMTNSYVPKVEDLWGRVKHLDATIPFIYVQSMKMFEESYLNKTLYSTQKYVGDKVLRSYGSMLEEFNKTSILAEDIQYSHSTYKINKLHYLARSNAYFSKDCIVEVTDENNKKYFIPYNIFSLFFESYDSHISNLKTNNKDLAPYLGKTLYYKNGFNHKFYKYSTKDKLTEKSPTMEINVGDKFKCVDIGFFRNRDRTGFQGLVLEANDGNKIIIPQKEDSYYGYKELYHQRHFYSYSNNKDFTESFVELEDYLTFVAEKKKQEEEKQKEKNIRDSYIQRNCKAYANYLANKEDYEVDRFIRLHKKYGGATAKDMLEGYVQIGWTKEKCRESWGEPRDINKSVGSWGIHEQWCYNGSYLYFENGRLTSIQN